MILYPGRLTGFRFIPESDILPGQPDSYPHPHTNAHRYSAPDPRGPAHVYSPNNNQAFSRHDEAMYRRGSTGAFHPPHQHHAHAHHQPYPSPDYATASYYSRSQQQQQQQQQHPSSPGDFGAGGQYANDYGPQLASPGPSQSSYAVNPYSPSAGGGTVTGASGYYQQQQEMGHFAQQQARPPQAYYTPTYPSNYPQ